MIPLSALAQPAPIAPFSGPRAAFIIGIESYGRARKLVNPTRDARAIEVTLKALGFRVSVETDRTRLRLLNAIEGFVEDHRGAALVLMFFAGHGVQVAGHNYLLPTDADVTTLARLQATALPLDDILSRIATVAPRRIVLLDACRNDPFGDALVPDNARGLSSTEFDAGSAMRLSAGLGRVGRADGTIYAFASAPGTTADDGMGDHSPFTDALVKHLSRGGLEFGSIMKLVQMDVYERTGGRQLPYIEDALPDLLFIDDLEQPLPERERLLLAMANIDDETRQQVERVAVSHDVPLAPLFGTLLGGETLIDLSFEQRERRLERAAEDFAKVRTELRSLASADPEVARLRQQAERDLSIGAFDAAREALTQAIAVDRTSGEQIEARLKERNLSEAESLATRAGLARTRGDYRGAAADFVAAEALAERWNKLKAWHYAVERARNLTDQGSLFGDNPALFDAIDAYRVARALVPMDRYPDEWAETQNGLGVALTRLGAREPESIRLEEAIAVLTAVLYDRPRERNPAAWAKTQNDLGRALFELGERSRDRARLQAAVDAFTAALEERTRERAPLDWAQTQAERGAALMRLGIRANDTKFLYEAVAANRESLKERWRERVPLDWARSQQSLGSALLHVGERETGTARIEQALDAYRTALQEQTRERAPLAWAALQNCIGRAQYLIGVRKEDRHWFEGAVHAHREANKELSRDRDPLEWASMQNNLANALADLGKLDIGSATMREALDVYRDVEKEWTRERVPLDWAMVQHNVGDILLAIARRESGIEPLEQSIAALRRSLEERTIESAPYKWAHTQGSLTLALQLFYERTGDASSLDEAIAITQSIIPVFEQAEAARFLEIAHGMLSTMQAQRAAHQG